MKKKKKKKMIIIVKRDERGIIRIVCFRSTDFLDLPEKNVPI
jgi:hypothetical protein